MSNKTKVKSATRISEDHREATNNLHESPSFGRKAKLSPWVIREKSFKQKRLKNAYCSPTSSPWNLRTTTLVESAHGFRLRLIKSATVTDVSHGAVRAPFERRSSAVRAPVKGNRRARDSSKEASARRRTNELVKGISSSCYTQARCWSDSSPYRAVITLMYDYYLPRIAARKQKSHFSKSSVNAEDNAARSASNDARLTSNLPKDVAVHFGNFYGLRESANQPRPGKIQGSSNHESQATRTTPRLEFTRQMVHKLERTAGTEEYARQVSALLEETVEPAHFRLHSLPAENSIPDGGTQNPSGYPLWYKEPYKRPLAQDEICKLLKSEEASWNSKDIFDEDLSETDSIEYVSDEEDILNDPETGDAIQKPESVGNLLSSVSSSVTEAKDTDYTSSDSR